MVIVFGNGMPDNQFFYETFSLFPMKTGLLNKDKEYLEVMHIYCCNCALLFHIQDPEAIPKFIDTAIPDILPCKVNTECGISLFLKGNPYKR